MGGPAIDTSGPVAPLRLLKRRHGQRWTELLHCRPDQMPLVEQLVALVARIDPQVEFELRNLTGEILAQRERQRADQRAERPA